MRKSIIWTAVLGSLAWMMLVYATAPADAAKSTCQVKAAARESPLRRLVTTTRIWMSCVYVAKADAMSGGLAPPWLAAGTQPATVNRSRLQSTGDPITSN
jgi:hypothetical protein